jgi:hypothetical protein
VTAPESGRRRLGYSTPPVPASALDAVRDGSLSYAEFAVLAFLYWRSNWAKLTAQLSLEQIAEGVAWTLSRGRLWETIRDLAAKGWLRYTTRTGPKARYSFTLARGEPFKRPETVRKSKTPATESAAAAEPRIRRVRITERRPGGGCLLSGPLFYDP